MNIRYRPSDSAVFMGQEKCAPRHQHVCVCIGYRQVSESWPRPVNLLKENVGQLLFMQRNRQRKEGKEKGTICGINGE